MRSGDVTLRISRSATVCFAPGQQDGDEAPFSICECEKSSCCALRASGQQPATIAPSMLKCLLNEIPGCGSSSSFLSAQFAVLDQPHTAYQHDCADSS